MEGVPNLINICPTNPIRILNQHDFWRYCVCPPNDTFDKIKNIDVGTGALQQRQEVYEG